MCLYLIIILLIFSGANMRFDRNLVIKAQSGDKEAFAKLYYSCYKDVYGFAFYTLGSADDAADVASDVFADVWKEIKNLRDADSFGSWIFRILSSRCKKEISRRIDRRAICSLEEITEVPLPDSERMEEDIAESASLYSALAELEPEERMIVVLSAIHGYKNREIAKMLGKPLGTVSSRLYRAYEQLRKRLQ